MDACVRLGETRQVAEGDMIYIERFLDALVFGRSVVPHIYAARAAV